MVKLGKVTGVDRSFGAGLMWLSAIWIFYLILVGEQIAANGGLIGCVIFYICFFISDLFRSRVPVYFALMTGCLLSVPVIAYTTQDAVSEDIVIWFGVLIVSFLVWRCFVQLSQVWAIVFGVLGVSVLVLITLIAEGWMLAPFIVAYGSALMSAGIVYRSLSMSRTESGDRYEALLDEYRKLKRHAKQNEDIARIEERTYIARKIHDSVGHKLTALLMQIEMFRMKAEGDELKASVEQLKRLASESLAETRSAVKALKEEEPGGLQALMRLIRNLEAESFMQIEFIVRHGAMSVTLGNAQSIAVYRAIQEALTNAMRHGSSRKVTIVLEAPGGSVFRFEVSNETNLDPEHPVREGFGLGAMRDRVEQAGGTLEISRSRNLFVVRGSFVLQS